MTIPNLHILPISPGDWPPPPNDIEIDGIALASKPELHITLIGSALAHELRTTFSDAFLGRALGAARAAQDWQYTRSGIRLLLRRPYGTGADQLIAHSLVELIELPAMADFHRALGRLLGRQLPVPPAHVTLYTAGRDKGIGVSTAARLRAFTVLQVVDIP